MKRIIHILTIISTTWAEHAVCQNLVPNPSFEVYTECPPGGNTGEPLQCIPWTQANEATADYFNVCSPPGEAGIPTNFAGEQWPVTGVAYVGGCSRSFGVNYREYVQTQLDNPLVADAAYQVSFYISPGEELCATQPFGALFTVGIPVYDGESVLDYPPQIEVNGGFLNNYADWTLISRCFIAEGGEYYITIGNFRDDSETPIEPGCNGTVAYYYIDQVTVIEMPLSEEEFFLEPVTACGSYTINPGSAQNYLWSDGTTNPTLTVIESGTYYVTLSDACAFSYGEIEVTIIPDSPPVVLPNDTLLCSGESLDISLDPDAGIYVWQDQSNDNEYTITQEGLFVVTLTDDCDMTSDTINVSFMDPPPAFSLGQDTLICDGDAFVISFDPSLGDFEWQDQSTSSSYTINDDGIYALTISNMCGEVSDEMNVDFVEQIIFSIGPEQMTLCDGNEFQIDLDPSLGEFLWSDDSEGNTFTITEAGMVSVTVSNICYSVTDEMLVEVLYQPEFTLGADITVCAGDLPITLDLSDVDHAQAWEWTGGSTQSIFQVTLPGTYSVTISNDCFAMSDEIVITIADADPVVILPADQLLCPGQTFILDADGLMGIYSWQDMSTADTFLVTAPGVYALTVTNICGSDADSIVIDYISVLAPPDLGSDFSLCPGETGVLYANVDGVLFLWTDVSTGSTSGTDSLMITSSGVYVLQISDACSSASDTIVITSNANPPNVDLPASVDLCQGDTVVIDAGVTGVQYLWSDASQLSSLSIHDPGSYSLTVSNACGSDADTIVILDAGPAPTVLLGADLSLCPGDVVNVIPVSSDVQSWLWQDSSTSSSLNVSSAGIVYVQGTNQCGLANDTINVTMLPATPPLDLGAYLSICPGETVTLTITEPNVDILWHASTGSAASDTTSTNPEFSLDTSGLITATISNACGSASDSVLVSLLDAAPSLDLGADQSLCPGETISFDPGINDVEYLWQDGSHGTSFQTTQSGTIILTISNDCGSATDTVIIIEDTNGPQVDLGPDLLACEGDIVTLSAGISGVEYLWHTSTGSVSTSSTTAVIASDTVFLTISNACGTDSDTIVVDIYGTIPTPSLGADTLLCEGEVLLLISDADVETSVVWQDGSLLSAFVVSQAGTYSLTEANHCGSGTDTIVVMFDSPPAAFDLGEDAVVCPGEFVLLIAPATTDVITWQDGSHDASFIADQEQVYSLQLSNNCGVTSDEVSLSFDDDIPELSLDQTISLCDDEVIVLDATQPFIATYAWSTGGILPSIQISTPGDYSVSVSTNCYTVHESVEVISDTDCNHTLFIPNVFSPNGDNVNDEWMVMFDDPAVTSIECKIFDRWGDKIYETTTTPIEWDGRFNDQAMLSGVYVYVLKLNYTEAETKLLSGDITLIR
ncbi:MAG TPA: gliding motility-associated C-terminal domain-containing protein [Saprospiraceae bacterium]|nr:gliding motility-associated C-terminal domain-containing protein [Saprospiraceae bacterium]